MIDAPLGLADVITVILAVSCLSVMAAQARERIVRIWRLSIPAIFAAVVAIVLLAGVFEATLAHDAEWLAGVGLGGLIGHVRGRTLAVEIDRVGGLVRVPRVADGLLAAVGLILLSLIDFALDALRSPVIHPIHIAAAAAFCAGFIGLRAIDIIARSSHATHVELRGTERR